LELLSNIQIGLSPEYRYVDGWARFPRALTARSRIGLEAATSRPIGWTGRRTSEQVLSGRLDNSDERPHRVGMDSTARGAPRYGCGSNNGASGSRRAAPAGSNLGGLAQDRRVFEADRARELSSQPWPQVRDIAHPTRSSGRSTSLAHLGAQGVSYSRRRRGCGSSAAEVAWRVDVPGERYRCRQVGAAVEA